MDWLCPPQPNRHLRAWQEYQPAMYLAELFRHSSGPQSSCCSVCTQPSTKLYRCNSCLGFHAQCAACLLSSHRLLPTHSVSIWTGTFWKDHSLFELGLVVHLDHAMGTCTGAHSTSSIWVGDISGFSKVTVCFKPVTNKETKGAQLLRFGLFPCSDSQPKSAFTLAALEHFSIFGTLGKGSTHKYYAALERLTQTGFPDKVPDRYRELALTHRKYCHLINLKRSGVTYPKHASGMFRDTRSLQCVACPHPGVNFFPIEISEDEL